MTPEAVDEDGAMGQVVERLAVGFPGVDSETVSAIVREAYAAFNEATVRDFIPVLVERQARALLRSAAPGVSPDQARTRRDPVAFS